jgi:hypothetical protein
MTYLGIRALVAFVTVACLGVGLWLVGTASNGASLRGVGVLFMILGGVGAIALLMRWLFYRRIG